MLNCLIIVPLEGDYGAPGASIPSMAVMGNKKFGCLTHAVTFQFRIDLHDFCFFLQLD
jgi:hypothetical protein